MLSASNGSREDIHSCCMFLLECNMCCDPLLYTRCLGTGLHVGVQLVHSHLDNFRSYGNWLCPHSTCRDLLERKPCPRNRSHLQLPSRLGQWGRRGCHICPPSRNIHEIVSGCNPHRHSNVDVHWALASSHRDTGRLCIYLLARSKQGDQSPDIQGQRTGQSMHALHSFRGLDKPRCCNSPA